MSIALPIAMGLSVLSLIPIIFLIEKGIVPSQSVLFSLGALFISMVTFVVWAKLEK